MNDFLTPENHRPTPPTTPPVAPPIVLTGSPTPIKKSALSGSLTAGNTPRSPAAWRDDSSASARTGRRGLLSVRQRLSERDHAILRDVARHRFLTTRHIRQLHFDSHASEHAGDRACRNALHRLHELRLLSHLDRRVGGVRAGSASFVWTIGPVGDRLLRLDSGNAIRHRLHEPSVRFLDHCLAIADLHLALVLAHRQQRIDLITVDTEPDCWRPFTGLGGEANVLQPDLALVTGAGQFEDHWFIEVDLGTEHLPTIIKKCRQYQAYRQTGTEQHDGGVFPAVVWVMSSQARVAQLQAALRATHQIRADLFRLTTPERFIELVAGGAV